MKRLTLAVLLCCLSLICVGATAEEKTQSCLHPVFGEWAKALEAGDEEAATKFYSSSEDVIAIESKGTVRKGTEGIRQMYVDAFKEVIFKNVNVNPIQVSLGDDYGFVYFILRTHTQMKEDKSNWELHVQATWLVRKEGEAWKVIAEHISPIEGVPRVKNLDEEKANKTAK